jgi:hypothetical protein
MGSTICSNTDEEAQNGVSKLRWRWSMIGWLSCGQHWLDAELRRLRHADARHSNPILTPPTLLFFPSFSLLQQIEVAQCVANPSI